jgi:predicted RNA-binding Zn ribbon-like protein
MVSDHDPQAAPGPLETVRQLLNTWAIPNDTRQPTDRFDAYRRERRLGPSDGATLRELRDDLRTVVESTADADEVITGWVERLGIQVVVDGGAVRFRQPGKTGAAGETLVVVLDAVAAGTWSRLKACPDCRWAFYDHTRSGTKRWCFMNTTGPNVRGCGNIAKARRRRARERTPTRPA